MKKERDKAKDELKGSMWIIQEKDTEIRILTKEKDSI